MRIRKIASGAKYRMDEQFQNLLIFGFFQVLIFWKFVNFTFWKIPKNSHLENYPISQVAIID